MRALLTLCTLFALLLSAPAHAGQLVSDLDQLEWDEVDPDTVRVLFMPLIDEVGLGGLGQRAANLLMLEVFRDLRVPDEGVGHGLAVLVRHGEVRDRAQAESIAREYFADIVVWGEVHRIGSDILVDTWATAVAAPEADPNRGVWREQATLNGEPLDVQIELPMAHLQLPTIVMPGAAVDRAEFSLPICDRKRSCDPDCSSGCGRSLGTAGGQLLALRHEGAWTLVRAITLEGGMVDGWIDMSGLTAAESRAADQISALVRLLRRDWWGAEELLTPQVEDSGPLVGHAPLWLAWAWAMSGNPDAARELLGRYDTAWSREGATCALLALLASRDGSGAVPAQHLEQVRLAAAELSRSSPDDSPVVASLKVAFQPTWIELARHGCDDGDGDACGRLGRLLAQQQQHARAAGRDLDAVDLGLDAVAAWRSACILGEAEGCRAAGRLLASDDSLPRPTTSGGARPAPLEERLLRKACDQQLASGCLDLGRLLARQAGPAGRGSYPTASSCACVAAYRS